MNTWQTIAPFIGVGILSLTLIIDLYTDTRPDVLVNHVRGWWLRLIGFIPAFWLMGPWSIPLVFAYWAVFDSGWGIIKHLGLLYVGTTARLDVLQRKYRWLQGFKYVAGAGSIILFIVKF